MDWLFASLGQRSVKAFCFLLKISLAWLGWRLPLLVRGVAGAPSSLAAFVLGHLAVQFDAQYDSVLPLLRLRAGFCVDKVISGFP